MFNANLHAPPYPLYTAEQLREQQIQRRVNRLWPSRSSGDPQRDAELLAHRSRIAALMTEHGGREPRCRTVGCEDPYFNQHRVRQHGVHIYRHCPGCDRLCEYRYDAEPGLVNIAPPNNGIMSYMILVPQTGRIPDHVLEPTDFHSLQDAQELAVKLDRNLADRHVIDDDARRQVVDVFSRLADNVARDGASDDDAHCSVELQVRQEQRREGAALQNNFRHRRVRLRTRHQRHGHHEPANVSSRHPAAERPPGNPLGWRSVHQIRLPRTQPVSRQIPAGDDGESRRNVPDRLTSGDEKNRRTAVSVMNNACLITGTPRSGTYPSRLPKIW